MRGFTILETLMVIAIFSMLIVVLVSFEVSVFRQNVFHQDSFAAHQDARLALWQMASELRAASPSDGGAYPISEATKNSLTFYTDLDQSGSRSQIRYYLNGSNLERGITKSSGVPPIYDLSTETKTLLVSNLSESDPFVFTYFDRNYAGTSTPLSFPVNVAAIRMVKIDFKIKTGPAGSSGTASYSTKVMIRSLKDNS